MHAQSYEIKNFADNIICGAWLILENSENFMPRKFLALRYSLIVNTSLFSTVIHCDSFNDCSASSADKLVRAASFHFTSCCICVYSTGHSIKDQHGK